MPLYILSSECSFLCLQLAIHYLEVKENLQAGLTLVITGHCKNTRIKTPCSNRINFSLTFSKLVEYSFAWTQIQIPEPDSELDSEPDFHVLAMKTTNGQKWPWPRGRRQLLFATHRGLCGSIIDTAYPLPLWVIFLVTVLVPKRILAAIEHASCGKVPCNYRLPASVFL